MRSRGEGDSGFCGEAEAMGAYVLSLSSSLSPISLEQLSNGRG